MEKTVARRRALLPISWRCHACRRRHPGRPPPRQRPSSASRCAPSWPRSSCKSMVRGARAARKRAAILPRGHGRDHLQGAPAVRRLHRPHGPGADVRGLCRTGLPARGEPRSSRWREQGLRFLQAALRRHDPRPRPDQGNLQRRHRRVVGRQQPWPPEAGA
jgi:hypothetical protein